MNNFSEQLELISCRDRQTIEKICTQTFSSSPTLRGRGRTSSDGSMVRVYLEIDPNIMTTCVLYATELSKSKEALPNSVSLRKVIEFFINSINLLNPNLKQRNS